MNIVIVSTSMGMGGTDQQISQIARHLSDRGHTVSVISLLPTGKMGRELAESGVSVTHLSMRRGVADPRCIYYLYKIIQEKEADILSSFLVHANIVSRLAGWLSATPVVTSIRNDDYCNGIECLIERTTNWIDKAWVANSAIVARRKIDQKVVARRKSNVIYNCIDTDIYRPNEISRHEIRSNLGVEEKEFLWVAVGRIEEQKDYPTMLRAVAKVTPEHNFCLAVAGKGSLKKDVLAVRDQLELQDKVAFLGVRRDVPDLLAAADGFVLSSISEGLPNVVMEALATETPVVSTEVGGVSELVDHGKSGFLVQPSSSSELAQSMSELMDVDEKNRKKMGIEGRKRVIHQCSYANIVDEWEALYKKHASLESS